MELERLRFSVYRWMLLGEEITVVADLHFEELTVIPKNHKNKTKRVWVRSLIHRCNVMEASDNLWEFLAVMQVDIHFLLHYDTQKSSNSVTIQKFLPHGSEKKTLLQFQYSNESSSKSWTAAGRKYLLCICLMILYLKIEHYWGIKTQLGGSLCWLWSCTSNCSCTIYIEQDSHDKCMKPQLCVN